MAVKKTADAVKKTAAAAKETVKETAVKAAETVKTETKAVKEAVKAKTETAKAPAKKTQKPEAKKETVVLQFAGKEVDMDAIIESARADFKANNKGCIRKLEVYVKPEDSAAYYVVNGKTSGKVEI